MNSSRTRKARKWSLRMTVLTSLCVAVAMLLACGSGSNGDSETPDDAENEGPIVTRSADTFSVESFVAAGFKKSKEFSTETVPEATSIWYGFYSQRDVEIRFYESHDRALGPGVESAEAAVGRSPNSNIGGGIITSAGNRTQYNDFLVAGNTVILCQTDVLPCSEMAESAQATQ